MTFRYLIFDRQDEDLLNGALEVYEAALGLELDRRSGDKSIPDRLKVPGRNRERGREILDAPGPGR